jgi:hypothetical protein
MPNTGALIAKRVRDAVVLNLRRVFALDVDYPYVENLDGSLNFDLTKISINDVTPGDHLFYPSIIVSTLSGEESRFLQEDFISSTRDKDDNIFEVRGASIHFMVNIQAQALDTIVRDELLDRIYQKFKLITDDLADRGVAIIKTTLEGDKREFIQDRWIYSSGVRMSLYGEWIEEEGVDPNQTVGKLTGVIVTETGQVRQEYRVL